MPNWVYNTLNVSGTPDDIKKFADKARQPRLESNDEGQSIVVSESGDELSFWNFIAPPTEKHDLYFGRADGTEDKEWNWYNWNIKHWGVKWDANDVSMSIEYDEIDDKTVALAYYFATAWSIPEELFSVMVGQHPELEFNLRGVEEQGWGATLSGSEGHYSLDTQWEIPSSHKEWVDTDQEESCRCSNGYEEDEENWYSDCPRKKQEFVIVIQKSYRVITNTAENAYELAMEQGDNPDEQMEVLTDETIAWVIDKDKNRIYPKL